jgi:glycosyltransferase involved in cell wall biosynthesis
MSILYFTLEDISSGLFNAQVLGHLRMLKKLDPSLKVTLLVVNQQWKLRKHFERFKEIKSYDIELIYLPLLPPMRWYALSQKVTILYLNYLSFVVKTFVRLKDFRVIHCRHYLTSMIIQNCGFKNFIFDARSLHIHEFVQAEKIVYNSSNYKFWLAEERKLLENAAYVTVVSKAMATYFKSVLDRSIMYCPIIVNSDVLNFNLDYRNKIRYELGWMEKRIYVYSGSFGLYGINKDYLVKLIRLIRAYDNNSSFIFLVSNPSKEICALRDQCGISQEDVYIANVKYNEMYMYLSAADVGIHSLPHQLDWETRLGTKIVEYWSTGLPVLINDNVGEAAYLTSEFSLGKVLNLEKVYSKKHFEDIFLYLDSIDRKYIRNFTRSIFDSCRVSQDYLNIYNSFN